MNDSTFVGWRKSSHSGDGNSCVEVASTRHPAGSCGVGVRDTTQDGRGPVLEFSRAAWAEFIGRAESALDLVRWAEHRRPRPVMMAGGGGRPPLAAWAPGRGDPAGARAAKACAADCANK